MFDQYTESVLIFMLINVVLALSLYLPVSAGLLSLGQGGFMAIGAYTSSYLTVTFAWPFLAALVAGGLAAFLVGVIVGFPALRIKGVYLIILTMGFGEIVRVFFLNFERTGAASGLGGIPGHTTLPWLIAVVAVLLAGFWQLRRSRMGRAIAAVREDELAAEIIGINLTRVKIAVFAIGGALAGLAGGFYAHYASFIDPAQFGFHRSAEIFIMVLLGGMGNFIGATLGAVTVTLLPEVLRFLQDWRMTFFGTLLIVMMILRPWGLVGARR
ncbi:branched-chain amino acid ABC transporter permease [Ramlibacter henchirensis]|uniref:Branched-chain amino acid ABC transporter permease n=1 Tax=Ramlibacter henchirensis TaxID=204072 RepID=A0A4Z0BUW9_9BURK|nr:branched-chain amino acid ABC transporter permease [Ramlibacter henchirensis]TFZ02621.1 branched-chain amino acid ABC transporter permease [Ramlibacter henchirensis]